jgi:hypothetical protein
LCFGFLLQIIYTYFPFFLLTLLHPSHSFLTELRTFIPLVCSTFCGIRRFDKRDVRAEVVVGFVVEIIGRRRAHVWMLRWRGVVKKRRRSGRRRVRGNIVVEGAAGEGFWGVEDWARRWWGIRVEDCE